MRFHKNIIFREDNKNYDMIHQSAVFVCSHIILSSNFNFKFIRKFYIEIHTRKLKVKYFIFSIKKKIEMENKIGN